MRHRFRFFSTVLIVAFAALGLFAVSSAQSVNSNVGTSGFSFLKINSGARAVSMGGAFTGLADDVSALYYNPAGLATLEGKHWIVGYHNYFIDLQSGLLGFTTEIDYGTVLGVYASYLDYGDFVETTDDGEAIGEFGGGDLLLGVSLAKAIREQYQVGVTAKFVYERLEDFSATGLALDIGARWNSFRGRYSAGVVLQNLGFQLSALGSEKDKLPLMFRGGGAIRPKGLPVRFAADVIASIDNDFELAFGGEYMELEPLFVRVGWNSYGSNYRTLDSDDGWAGFTLGAGFDVRRMHIAYALTLGAELGESHRITWTGEF
jgi:hypothetical protein